MPTALTTQLEAVNVILATFGEGPLASLPADSTDADGTNATTVLDEISKEVQLEGWHFNTEKEVELTPNSAGQIAVPTDALRIDLSNSTPDVTQKGGYVYDLDEKSSTGWGTSSRKFDIVYYRDFTDLPEAANRYITIRAARVFQKRYLGDREVHAFTQEDELRARATLLEHEQFVGDPTLLDAFPQHMTVNRNNPLWGF